MLDFSHDHHREEQQLGAPVATRGLPGGADAVAAMAAARDQVAQAVSVSPARLSNRDLTAIATELAALQSQVEACRLAISAEAQARGARGPVGDRADTDAAAWLGRLTGDPAEVLRGGLWIAKLLQTRYATTRRALESGQLRLSQAKVIVRSAERAPKRLTREQVAEAEVSLVATATGEGSRSGRPMTARRLRQEARRMFAEVRGVTPDESGAHEAGEIEAEEDSAERECYLSLNDRGDGTYRGTFVVPELHGRLLEAALERLSAPRRLHRDQHGRSVEDESRSVIGSSRPENHGQAFCELLEHLPTEQQGHGAGNAATLLVMVALEEPASRSGCRPPRHRRRGLTPHRPPTRVQRRHPARGARWSLRPARRRARAAALHPPSAPGPGHAVRLVRSPGV